MTSRIVFAALTCLGLAVLAPSAQAADDLPFFADESAPRFAAQPMANLPELNGYVPGDRPDPNPWTGLTVGSEVFGVSGSGHGSHGGFGGGGFVGYNHEFANNVVVGVQGSAGYLPGLYKYGPSGYNYGLAQVNVGYDMGRLMPYVTLGVGLASPTNGLNGVPNGLDSLNNMFVHSGQSQTQTLTEVGAGFNYAVNEHLTVGMGVTAIQSHGNVSAVPPLGAGFLP